MVDVSFQPIFIDDVYELFIKRENDDPYEIPLVVAYGLLICHKDYLSELPEESMQVVYEKYDEVILTAAYEGIPSYLIKDDSYLDTITIEDIKVSENVCLVLSIRIHENEVIVLTNRS